MSLLTHILKLLKWDTTDVEDLEQEFDIDKSLNENWDKLDDFAERVDDVVIDIQDNIEDIKNKDTQQDKLIQKLQSNMINESTQEATSLHVTDASDLPAVLTIEGNYYQEQQEGTDNLAVLNEGTIAQDGITINIKDGVATMSGANTSDATNYIVIGTAYLYAGQTYYMSAERNQTSGSCGFSLKRGTKIPWFTVGEEKTYECTETGEYEVRVSFGVSSATISGTFKLLVSKTSGANWVQGKKSIPSLEYSSKTKTVGSNINYFSEDYYNYFSINQQAMKEIIENEIKVTTTANAYSGIFLNTSNTTITELLDKLKNKDVTFSFEAKADTDISLEYGKTGNSKKSNLTNEYQKFYVTYLDVTNIEIYFYNSSATVTNFYIKNIKLEEGTEATSFSHFRNGFIKDYTA